MSVAADSERDDERSAYRERIGHLGRPPPNETLRRMMITWVRSSLSRDLDALPGRGMYPQQRVALCGVYILLASCSMAHHLGRKSAADALRRLADRLENERGLE
jgi:hypothetical protein